MPDPKHYVIVWDWKEQPPWNEVAAAQRDGMPYVTPVDDTGSDAYAVVMSDAPLTDVQAQHVYDDITNAEDACPGCGCLPGEGTTLGCTHPDGCGFESDR